MRDRLIPERDDAVGGLSRSFVDERGFTWDIGGHVIFSHYPLYTRLLDELLTPAGWRASRHGSCARDLRVHGLVEERW